MQAHPLSSPAARIPSLHRTSPPHAGLTKLRAESLQPPLVSVPPKPLTAPRLIQLDDSPQPYLPVAEHAGLAHDAGNLLGALRLYSDLLDMPGVLRPEHRHYAADLHLIAARSSALIQRLLVSVAIHDNAALPCQPDAIKNGSGRPVHPAAALLTLAPVLERIAAGAACVIVTIPTMLPPIELSAEALERITVNLVRNAAEAIRSSREQSGRCSHPEALGQIRVTLESVAATLCLTVEDDGPGMPPVVAAAFMRPAPLPAGAIRGLGHRIVHELATQTGAQLSIRVRPGRGTTFCLRWPLAGDSSQHSPLAPLRQASILSGGATSC